MTKQESDRAVISLSVEIVKLKDIIKALEKRIKLLEESK